MYRFDRYDVDTICIKIGGAGAGGEISLSAGTSVQGVGGEVTLSGGQG
jgi:hypothetical protein